MTYKKKPTSLCKKRIALDLLDIIDAAMVFYYIRNIYNDNLDAFNRFYRVI